MSDPKESNLQNAIEDIIQVFHSYSGKEGDKYKLTKTELKNLLKGELSDFLRCSKNPIMVEKIMADLDEDQDGQVDFKEFIILVGVLTIACNEFFKDCPTDSGSNKD
uniref:protein S100-A1-like n=1 Tax=Epinephelus lanceolatus TaxID=310571 RepID=UPI001445C676|nr:protein S100-A1-like [Epinephelus lanceolatus]